ncbi:MAG: hypothetical protein ACO0C9_04265 [Candidatus Methanosuratincola verstraetei]|jgi:hypothetical protein
MRPDLATEPEFITNRLFFDLKVADKSLNLGLDFHTEKRIDGGKADLVVEKLEEIEKEL